jgi:beta-lactamase class A
MNRRALSIFGALGFLGGLGLPAVSVLADPIKSRTRAAASELRLRELETIAQGRLGVHLVDTGTGRELSYRADERFMMLSTFKLLASAVVLARVDAGAESLQRRITYSSKELVEHSPVTAKYADGEGMTLGQLCEATLTTSDNTAANLILASYGGPAALTAMARKIGDRVTRLDRIETELNVKQPEGSLCKKWCWGTLFLRNRANFFNNGCWPTRPAVTA